MKRTAVLLALLAVTASVPASALAGSAQTDAYAGSHTTFETQSTAVVDYTVDGNQMFESVRVQSQSTLDSQTSLEGSADAGAISTMTGAVLSVDAESDASASLRSDSGARVEAHDNEYGTLVVAADDESQYVAVNASASSESTQVGESRVVFTTGSGADATAMVVGNGSVAVTQDGNLTASLDRDSKLVVRTYAEGRTEAEATSERMIVNETAAASVYVMNQGGAAVTDTVTYGQNTTIDVAQRSESQVNMTVTRAESEGRVVIAHVENTTFESVDEVSVAVDGDAAARTSSYAELRGATDGDASKYMVRQSTAAESSADVDVLVGVDHFSTRAVTMTDTTGRTSAFSGVVATYNADGDATIDIGELGAAASAYVDGQITITELGDVAAAYATS